jgi:hypothetical protein
VQLQKPTQPLTSPGLSSQAPTLYSDDADESGGSEGLVNALSIVGFIAALVVLYFQVTTAGVWIKAEDNAKSGDWSQLMD